MTNILNNENTYYDKYQKYKIKYLSLKNIQTGGVFNKKIVMCNDTHSSDKPLIAYIMPKILFVMFLGNGANIKDWNENTKSKFLDRLKTLGSVYVYQDKVHNILHYDLNFPDHKEYDNDINFDLSYVKPNSHIKLVRNDISNKYKNIDDYKFIPIGWSAGSLLAQYFTQSYASQCLHCILIEPASIPINFIISEQFTVKSNIQFKKMLQNLKYCNTDDIVLMENIIWNLRLSFYSKHLKLKLQVPTTSFVNIEYPEIHKGNNKIRFDEIKLMNKHNPDKYEAIIFINKTHTIFNFIQPAKQIIKYCKSIITKI